MTPSAHFDKSSGENLFKRIRPLDNAFQCMGYIDSNHIRVGILRTLSSALIFPQILLLSAHIVHTKTRNQLNLLAISCRPSWGLYKNGADWSSWFYRACAVGIGQHKQSSPSLRPARYRVASVTSFTMSNTSFRVEVLRRTSAIVR